MLTMALMCLGAVVGRFVLPHWWARANSRVQLVLTVLLIFTMGVSIGRNEDLLHNLGTIGLDSALFCLIPMAVSIALAHLLAKRVFGAGEGEGEGEGE